MIVCDLYLGDKMDHVENHTILLQARNGLERLENEEFYFYGVFNNCFKLDDMVLEALEDPSDGYRSYFGAVFHNTENSSEVKNFFRRPLAKVKLKSLKEDTEEYYRTEKFDGWCLVDVTNGHRWLQFGTGNCADYYPYFTFYYNPDKNQKDFPTIDPDYVPFKKRHPEILLSYPRWFSGEKADFVNW